MNKLQPGTRVQAQNAFGDWIEKVATTGVVRGHDFPVIWVKPVEERGDPVPWPADAVRPLPVSPQDATGR
jgi:hypothetical protein